VRSLVTVSQDWHARWLTTGCGPGHRKPCRCQCAIFCAERNGARITRAGTGLSTPSPRSHGAASHRARTSRDVVRAARSASGRGYPQFVVDEFDKYERCGIFAYGVVRVYCETCRQSDVVAFSCEGRALCPSCTGRRMADVVDHVLPVARYRQWTLTFPWPIRIMLVQHPALVTALQKIMVRRIERFLRRRARGHGVPRDERTHTGAVVAIQRFGSRLNYPAPSVRSFAPCLAYSFPRRDPPRCLGFARRRAHRRRFSATGRRRYLAQLVLADIVARKPSILDDCSTAAPSPRKLIAHCDGFSLECKPCVASTDRAGLEGLLRYGPAPSVRSFAPFPGAACLRARSRRAFGKWQRVLPVAKGGDTFESAFHVLKRGGHLVTAVDFQAKKKH
jgi:hypothetical protein